MALVPAMRAMCGIQRNCQHFCVWLSLLPVQLENTSEGGDGITGPQRSRASSRISGGLQPWHSSEPVSVSAAGTLPAGLSFSGCPGCAPGRPGADPISWQPQSSAFPAGAVVCISTLYPRAPNFTLPVPKGVLGIYLLCIPLWALGHAV